MDWPIQQVARLCGVTTRTLRHYDQIGLLTPTRTAGNGLRYYDADALTRLQRILMLRDLGLGLPAIAEVLDGQTDDVAALRGHLAWLESERERLAHQIRAVQHTIEKKKRGETPMAEQMFEGFDHTQYKEEVEQRWGKQAYADGDRWWRGLSQDEKAAFMNEVKSLNETWQRTFAAGHTPESAEAQAVAQRHYRWLTSAYQGKAPGKEHLIGLAQMYVDDPRFAANYEASTSDGGAEFVRDALIEYAEQNL